MGEPFTRRGWLKEALAWIRLQAGSLSTEESQTVTRVSNAFCAGERIDPEVDKAFLELLRTRQYPILVAETSRGPAPPV